VVERYARSPHVDGQAVGTGSAADDLLRLGCLLYGGDDTHRHAQARALLRSQPELAGVTVATAAAVGDVAAARRFLNEDPGCAARTGGPFDWEPLLYLTYSRINSDDPAHDPLAVARLLLDAGADPNAGYLWDGTYPFTALTGAFGGGEDKTNQPPHRHALALARLLLEGGADPNDSQALYNSSCSSSSVSVPARAGPGTPGSTPPTAPRRSSSRTSSSPPPSRTAPTGPASPWRPALTPTASAPGTRSDMG
jgi:hypothetical protein